MAAVDEVRTELGALEGKSRDFFGAVDDALRSLDTAGPVPIPPELIAAVQDGMRRVAEALQDVVDRFQQVLDQPGDPDELRRVAGGWRAVGNDLGRDAGDVGLDRMQANYRWAGSAAEAYRAMVPPQSARLSTMKDRCIGVATSLEALADQIESFWYALLGALVGMSIAVAAAVVAAVGVVTIPAACGAVLIVVAGGVTTITVALTALNTLNDRVVTELRAADQALHDLGDRWPAPNTAAMADASAVDGDPSEWRPNR